MKKKITAILTAVALAASCVPAMAASSDWAKDIIAEAEAKGLADETVDWTLPITRSAFSKLAYLIFEDELNGLQIPGSSLIQDEEQMILEAFYRAGILTGRSDTEMDLAPQDDITREEAATIIYRLMNHMQLDTAYPETTDSFSDDNTISPWATDAVYTLKNAGIFHGDKNNAFAPQEHYTAEQALATLMRLQDKTKGSVPTEEPIEISTQAETFADKLDEHMPADRNYMFSPLSVKMAFALAANGAAGETQKEILDTIGIDDLDGFNENSKRLIELYAENELVSLNISNSIWLNKDKTEQRFSERYKDTIAEFYKGDADAVDSGNAVNSINGWVSEKTNGKISSVVSDADFWEMLINTIYFKGMWENEFSESATAPEMFTSRDGAQKDIDFMKNTGWYSYYSGGGIQAVELPYKRSVYLENLELLASKVNVSMYILTNGSEVKNPEETLDAVLPKLDKRYINLHMPKFRIEYDDELKDELMGMGIRKAFTDDLTAEFKPMLTFGSAYISDVIHKTYINIDEKGTEAAAVTALAMVGSGLPPEPTVVRFDKPFTFIIRDNSNEEILFIGEYAFAEQE